jgi:hypothetical protein
MAWLRKLRRERRVGTSRAYDDVLLATTIACIGTEEEENKPNPRRGSIVGRRTIARDRYSGYCRLMEDYFVSNSVRVRLLPDPTKSRGWPPALGTSLLTVDLPADESTKT